MMGVLYNVETHTINYHLKKIFSDNELEEDSVIRDFRITASDGKPYNTKHYNLKAIIAVGYKVNSERAVQFRKWVTDIIENYTIKAYAMDEMFQLVQDRLFESDFDRFAALETLIDEK
jgi:hypothetical protein